MFKYLPETTEKTNYIFFVVGLLGFGDNLQPRTSQNSLKKHVEMIEKSVILPNTFHVVAHLCTVYFECDTIFVFSSFSN